MSNFKSQILLGLLGALAAAASSFAQHMPYDLIIRRGTIYDGSGSPGEKEDLAIRGDRIAAVGVIRERGKREIDAAGFAVAPGFINMLSWATESLIQDGRGQSDLRQGVTLEVMGEGESMGPLNAAMKRDLRQQQADIHYPIAWTTLGQYLEWLTRRGISVNVASFVGATTLRVHEIGYADRPPTRAELARMETLAAQAMRDGALGVASALIYAPAFYAKTGELIALAKVARQYGGIYISHIRSEGDSLLEGVDELIRIAEAADVPAEIYHFKAAGRSNWPKLGAAVDRIEQARRRGLKITADMYCYTAAATGLDAAMPPWAQEGGYQAWAERLQNPAIRQRVKHQMSRPAKDWENFYVGAGGPGGILLVGFKNPKLKPLTGKTLAQVARLRRESPQDAAMDLVIEDGSRVGAIYFLMSEENVRREIKLPWVSFGSDAASLAPEGPFLKSNVHPRAYGNVARLLGRYVREEKLISLPEAIRRLTSFPASNLHLKNRGLLKAGYFADVAVFDPAKIIDHATYERPHQFATGVEEVIVNGQLVLDHGEPTGAPAGRVVRGRGWTGKGD